MTTTRDGAASVLLTLFPNGTPVPATSTTNDIPGAVVNNGAAVAVGAGGQICVFSLSTAHHIIDVDGWFADDSTVRVPPSSRRLLDTRDGTAPEAESTTCLDVVGNGVPSDVSAVVLNVTAVTPAAAGFVASFASGKEQPDTSALNYAAGETRATIGLVPVGRDGRVCLDTLSGTDLLVDLQAHQVPLPGPGTDTGQSAQVQPFRALDTRGGPKPAAESIRCIGVTGTGRAPTAAVAVAVSLAMLQPAGVAGVLSDAASVAVNLASVQAPEPGFLSVLPAGQALPGTSNLNIDVGEDLNNGAVVAVGEAGEICVYSHASAHHILDVTGWFGTASSVQALGAPRRLFDSRNGSRPVAGSTTCVEVIGSGVPVDANAVVLSIAAVRPSAAGFAVGYASGADPPAVSSLNCGPGDVRAGGGMVAIGNDGRVCVDTVAATDLVIDLQAYQAAADGLTDPGTVLLREPSGRVGTCTPGFEELVSADDVSWWDWVATIDAAGPVEDATAPSLFEIEAYHRVSLYERCADGTYVHDWVGDPLSHFERCAVVTSTVRTTPSRLGDIEWAAEQWTTAAETNPCPTTTDDLQIFPSDPADTGEDPEATTPIDPAAEAIRRLAGDGRQQTSAVIAGHAFPDGTTTGVIAEESSGLPAAMAMGATQTGPVLLVGDTVAPEVLDAVVALGAHQVLSVGVTDSGVDTQLSDEMARGRDVAAIEGDDVFGMGASIALSGWPTGATTVYLAEADQLADGLAGGTLTDGPIVRVPADGELPSQVADAVDRLNPDRVIALGGPDAISEGILRAAAGGRLAERVDGPSRFETAAAEIERLAPMEVIGLGGVDAVCDETLAAAGNLGAASHGEAAR